MFVVYVLRSRTTHRYDTRLTSDSPKRLFEHNSDQSTSTKHRGPWGLVNHEEFATLIEAVRRERHLKTGHGRDELREILDGATPNSSVG
jgi:putative endonuclease